VSHRLKSKAVLLHVHVLFLCEIAKGTLFCMVNGKLPEYNGLPLFQIKKAYFVMRCVKYHKYSCLQADVTLSNWRLLSGLYLRPVAVS